MASAPGGGPWIAVGVGRATVGNRPPPEPDGSDGGVGVLVDRGRGEEETEIEQQIGDLVGGHQLTVLHGRESLVDHGQGLVDDVRRIGLGGHETNCTRDPASCDANEIRPSTHLPDQPQRAGRPPTSPTNFDAPTAPKPRSVGSTPPRAARHRPDLPSLSKVEPAQHGRRRPPLPANGNGP